MQNEAKDILGTVNDTANVEDVSTDVQIISDPPLMVLAPEAEPTDADPEEKPNVVLSGKGEPLPEGPVIVGRVKIELPNEEGQRAGFYSPNASTLVGQYPQYKFKRETKGDKENVPTVSL